MPQVIVTRGAILGIERCRTFLKKAGVQVSRRASDAISRQFALLETSPEIGRPFQHNAELRELLIPFGASGYIALYRYEPDGDAVMFWPSAIRGKSAIRRRRADCNLLRAAFLTSG
ncbi:Plasmid stabilization system protein ParE [Xaviernesmea oryzae]|uniref:Plasmid stabilization system protein ParE n=1 Tax=Xaviernesmea oryzae TaxID=464029 RepID=A0A1X7GDM6_9HYPH|nr:type II toxin-antitoxin system RelE/ParE family toxin [Xaviernesmea oryzae]SMF68075.1 Plasmid stabilization system protein ParE [Xaviernesmea oryzae]